MKALITICARKGSKGLPSKNILPLLEKPLIVYSIEQALAWLHPKISSKRLVVSTDGNEIATLAKKAGAEVPFLRPSELASDTAGKLPVLSHALEECEKLERYDVVIDLDPTAPIRSTADLTKGFDTFLSKKSDVCFSVTKARKNPYFNMVEEKSDGEVGLVKAGSFSGRQAAPAVWDMNASIYVYNPAFLRKKPQTLWEGKTSIFEMPPETAFDIDSERDFWVVEALLKKTAGAKL